MRTVYRLILPLLFSLTFVTPASGAPNPMSDLADHWAALEIETALEQGWVNGYPDGRFLPDWTITRAEFIKMLSAAIHLQPGGETVSFLTEASRTYRSDSYLAAASHWFIEQGWGEVATVGGLLHPSDTGPTLPLPDQPITRQEIAALVVRALGLSAPKGHKTIAAPFADWEQIAPSARDHVQLAAAVGVLAGYADGTFGPERLATRAEAVTVITRLLNWMTRGLDQQIMVFVRRPSFQYPNDIPQPLSLPVPAQEIDGVLYVAARSIFGAAVDRLYPGESVNFRWDPVQQTLLFEYGVPYNFQVGATSSLFPPHREQSPPQLPTAARLLYGEVMIPVYSAIDKMPLWIEDPVWEPQAKILIITLHHPSQQIGENEMWPA